MASRPLIWPLWLGLVVLRLMGSERAYSWSLPLWKTKALYKIRQMDVAQAETTDSISSKDSLALRTFPSPGD